MCGCNMTEFPFIMPWLFLCVSIYDASLRILNATFKSLGIGTGWPFILFVSYFSGRVWTFFSTLKYWQEWICYSDRVSKPNMIALRKHQTIIQENMACPMLAWWLCVIPWLERDSGRRRKAIRFRFLNRVVGVARIQIENVVLCKIFCTEMTSDSIRSSWEISSSASKCN